MTNQLRSKARAKAMAQLTVQPRAGIFSRQFCSGLLCSGLLPCSFLFIPLLSSSVLSSFKMPNRGSAKKPLAAEFIGILKRERDTFDGKIRPLLTYQDKRLQLCLSLLNEDAGSKTRSEAQRFMRARVRRFLIEVLNRFGAELFLLCCMGTTLTNLAKFDIDESILSLSQWWESDSERPVGLTAKAEGICNEDFLRNHSTGLINTNYNYEAKILTRTRAFKSTSSNSGEPNPW
jgi:hypothetical protein